MSEIGEIAAGHGFSEEAAGAARDALRRSGGGMAQFDHPELGGMGQWTRGGMLMIGRMFDDRLKARVAALMDDLAGLPSSAGEAPTGSDGSGWWPADLGAPASAGGQNGIRYAVFPARHRLAVERDGRVTVHDTGERRITGVSQQQGNATSLRFSGPDGSVDLDDLPLAE